MKNILKDGLKLEANHPYDPTNKICDYGHILQLEPLMKQIPIQQIHLMIQINIIITHVNLVQDQILTLLLMENPFLKLIVVSVILI